MASQWISSLVLTLLAISVTVHAQHSTAPPFINRRAIVSHFNPTRNTTVNATTPMQVGNGNFAFGADITSLQTFLPFASMASWGWKNDSLPPGRTQADIDNYRGVSWDSHGKPVQYEFGGPADLEAWLRANPNRVNLGRVGLSFWPDKRGSSDAKLVTSETDLSNAKQTLDLWTGTLTSQFAFQGSNITVRVTSDLDTDTIAVTLESKLVEQGRLGLFLDFPWNEGADKFSAPFVGFWNATEKHTTSLDILNTRQAKITHRMESAVFDTDIRGDAHSVTRQSPASHLYEIRPNLPKGKDASQMFSLAIQFSPATKSRAKTVPSPLEIFSSSKRGWEKYWTQSGFVDVMTGSTDLRAEELQRRIILSRYLMRVNEAGDAPSQESGLVNDGWFGKFHMEMYFWHSAHWALWGNLPLLLRSSSIYTHFLPSSLDRARLQQGVPTNDTNTTTTPSPGARWPKMTDPSGRSAPGEINNLLVWQQPHPLFLALLSYRASPTLQTLRQWRPVIIATADWMSNSFAWWNRTSQVYDLGPPLHLMSEDTKPMETLNPAFELAYWNFGLGIAERWVKDLGESGLARSWKEVRTKLAPLPTSTAPESGEAETYSVFQGIHPNFWTDSAYTSDHPALVGLYGWLPPTPGLDVSRAKRTAEKVWTHWNTTNCWGWDFPMLAMSAARHDSPAQALEWLLHPLFQFDDVGMPIGGVRVPTPYFPSSGSFLYAIAFMARGWDGARQGHGGAPGFPADGTWNVRVEGMSKAP